MIDNKIKLDELAGMAKKTVINVASLADMLNVHPRTIDRMENKEQIPPHFCLGKEKCWFAGDLLKHFKKMAQKAQVKSDNEAGVIDYLN